MTPGRLCRVALREGPAGHVGSLISSDRKVAVRMVGSLRLGTIALQEYDRRAGDPVPRNRPAEGKRGTLCTRCCAATVMTESLPLRLLPFWSDSFDWDRFESFCLSVVRSLPDVKRADRYGVMGEAQQGIDIEADLHNGRKRTIQCRHRKRITRRQVEKIVADTTYPAGEHEIWVTVSGWDECQRLHRWSRRLDHKFR